MTVSQNIKEAITSKINAKTPLTDQDIADCKKGLTYIRKAIKGGGIAENKLGEAYKINADLAQHPFNNMLNKAVNKEPFDTAFFYTNLKDMTDAIQG